MAIPALWAFSYDKFEMAEIEFIIRLSCKENI